MIQTYASFFSFVDSIVISIRYKVCNMNGYWITYRDPSVCFILKTNPRPIYNLVDVCVYKIQHLIRSTLPNTATLHEEGISRPELVLA